MTRGSPTVPDRDAARKFLNDLWARVLVDEDATASPEISALVNSNQVAIRFCLPTQLLGKATNLSLDALCLQKGNGLDGKWDPRSFAKAVIVPWNGSNQNVLGPSGDPYVSNPLRRPRVDSGLEQMSDQDQWAALGDVLTRVQSAGTEQAAETCLRQTLVAIRNRLRELTFTYVVPPRVSLAQALKLVSDFLSTGSGGDRGLCVAAALFETFKTRFRTFASIRRGVINAADAATGAAGDLECIAEDGATIVLAVEVKERKIKDADIEAAIAKARQYAVRELVLCTHGIAQSDSEAAHSRIASAWASGTNVYHLTIQELVSSALPLAGEAGIHEFIVGIGAQLDSFSTQPKHRKDWKSLLDAL
ncbi:MAG: restriction endonuclease, SacI family [Micropepsaceae bacterium]